MGFLISVAHFTILQIVICNSNNVIALEYNILNHINDIDTHTFNLLSPIKQHLVHDNIIQLDNLKTDNKYKQITKKLIGIEKMGEEIAKSDYLPEEITEIKTPSPNKDQKKSMADIDDAIKNTSEELVSTNQSELESNESEIEERDKFLESTAEIFKNNNPLETKESHPTIESELEIIKNENDKQDFVCVPDYSLPCPKDYVLFDKYCIATKSYKGSCSHKIKAMIEEDYEFKEAWSKECKSNWPCMPEKCPNGTDYTKQCPISYTVDGIYCRSPIQINTKYVSFDNVDNKVKFEKENNVRWPCKLGYISNYANDCPKGYVKTNNQCKSIVDTNIVGCDIFIIPKTVDLKLNTQHKCKLEGW